MHQEHRSFGWRAPFSGFHWSRASVLVFVLVLVLAVAARMGVSWSAMPRPLDDPDNYLPLARSLSRGDGLQFNGRPTAYRPPLYPLVLAPLCLVGQDRSGSGVILLHAALGVATTALTMLAARRWGLPPLGLGIAGLIVACDPVLVAQSRQVMTETLATFCLAATLAAAAAPRSIPSACATGCWLGLASLTRPSLLPVGLLILLVSSLAHPRDFERPSRARWALCGAFALLVTLSPWVIRNAIVLGEPVWTTTHGGYTLALANNEVYAADMLGRGWDFDGVWTGPNQQRWFERMNENAAGLGEPEADRLFRDLALSWIRAHPRLFLEASAQRLSRFWAAAPSASVYGRPLRWVCLAWTLPLWMALAWSLTRGQSWRWPALAAISTIIALTAVHAVYWTDLRMRAPLVPSIALLVALGLTGSRRELQNTRDHVPE